MPVGTPPKPPSAPQQVQVTALWPDLEKHPAMAANGFLLQQTGQEFILTVGFTAPPFFSTPEEAMKVKTVEAQIIARLVLTPTRAVELLGLLQRGLANYQAQQKQ
ncbi:MAG: hypothetical protein ACYDC3_09910 [Candidatus Binataceae bacterium]